MCCAVSINSCWLAKGLASPMEDTVRRSGDYVYFQLGIPTLGALIECSGSSCLPTEDVVSGCEHRNDLIFIGKTFQMFDFRFVVTDYGFGAIRSVQLVVEPPAVRRGQHATLRCLYELDDSPLYSVKFYRGLREFYRYSPSQLPSKKIFPFPGINVDVSMTFQLLATKPSSAAPDAIVGATCPVLVAEALQLLLTPQLPEKKANRQQEKSN